MEEREGSSSGLIQNSYIADRDEVRTPGIPPESTGHTAGGGHGCSPQKSPSGPHGFIDVAASSPTPPTLSFMHNHPHSRYIQCLHPQTRSPLMWGMRGSSTVPDHTRQDVLEG